jgi:luciferase family oxidoreductase group 1
MMPTKTIAYSLLELAVISKGNTVQQTFENTVTIAQEAEALGYTRIWFAEHHNMKPVGSVVPPILVGHIAQQTNTIRVGAGGVMLPNHSPLAVAEQFGTLGNLFPNRIDLGLGRAPGTDRETAAAIKSDFLQAAHSFPQEVTQIELYFSTSNADATVRAIIAEGVDVPLYILGSSTDSAHLAAKKGLPYAFASHFASAYLEEALAIYHSKFIPSAALAAPYAITGINVIIAESDAEAERQFTSSLKMVLGIVTNKRDYLSEPADMTPDLEEIRQHPSIQNMIKYFFVGSKQTVKKQVMEFIKHSQTDELMVTTSAYHLEDRIRSLQAFAEIMKELNQ